MNRLQSTLLALTATVALSGCATNEMGVAAGMDLLRAATISDEQVRAMAAQAAQEYDAKNQVAPAGNKYAERLKRITANLKTPLNLPLNFKVYLTEEINAFAMADGTVRVYSGLMDLMNDQELVFVMGHEIGHVYFKHSKKAYRLAYAAQAARKGAASIGGTTGAVATGDLGGLAEKLLNAQFSQREETQADSFGLRILKLNGINPQAAVSALEKLGGGNSSIFSSHPGSKERAEAIRRQI